MRPPVRTDRCARGVAVLFKEADGRNVKASDAEGFVGREGRRYAAQSTVADEQCGEAERPQEICLKRRAGRAGAEHAARRLDQHERPPPRGIADALSTSGTDSVVRHNVRINGRTHALIGQRQKRLRVSETQRRWADGVSAHRTAPSDEAKARKSARV